MYRFSTFPESGAPEDSGAEDAATVADPSVPDLPPPQALTNNAHPSARIAVRRKLNIKQAPSLCFPFISQPARRGQGQTVERCRCGLKVPLWLKGAAPASDVQQQMLALPGADDLRKGLVLGFLDCRICQHEAISEQIDQRLRLAQQPQRLGQGARERDRQVVRAS